MDDERTIDHELGIGAEGEGDGRGYELEVDDTGDLDDAMRDALAAVEASEERLQSAAVDGGAEGTVDDDEFGRLQQELADLRDRSVRTLADFDNYRKRVARERREERRYAAADLIRDLLAVADNLERALSAEGGADDLKQGVELIYRQLGETLKRHGVERVAALGEPFDPLVHEAVARYEDEGVSEPLVSEEMQSGYLLYDRLLRPAMVRVAMPVDGEEEPGGEREE